MMCWYMYVGCVCEVYVMCWYMYVGCVCEVCVHVHVRCVCICTCEVCVYMYMCYSVSVTLYIPTLHYTTLGGGVQWVGYVPPPPRTPEKWGIGGNLVVFVKVSKSSVIGVISGVNVCEVYVCTRMCVWCWCSVYM